VGDMVRELRACVLDRHRRRPRPCPAPRPRPRHAIQAEEPRVTLLVIQLGTHPAGRACRAVPVAAQLKQSQQCWLRTKQLW